MQDWAGGQRLLEDLQGAALEMVACSCSPSLTAFAFVHVKKASSFSGDQ